jgi:hypothetical protein
MNLSDFEKQSSGLSLFDTWTAINPISTPIGDFSVELYMGIGDKRPPDGEMLQRANDLVALLLTEFEIIRDKLFEHYRMYAEVPGFEFSGVPYGLDREGIVKYVDDLALTVSRQRSLLGTRYSSRVYVIPQWDVEHGIYLARRGSEWRIEEH